MVGCIGRAGDSSCLSDVHDDHVLTGESTEDVAAVGQLAAVGQRVGGGMVRVVVGADHFTGGGGLHEHRVAQVDVGAVGCKKLNEENSVTA